MGNREIETKKKSLLINILSVDLPVDIQYRKAIEI